MVIYLPKLEVALGRFKMALMHLDGEVGLPTVEHFEIGLRALV